MIRRFLVLIIAGIIAYAVLQIGSVALAGPKQHNPAKLAQMGIDLTTPASTPKLTESQVRARAAGHWAGWWEHASDISVRRVFLVDRTTGARRPVWMVTLDGLQIWSIGPAASGPRAMNTQLNLFLDEDGTPLFDFTYQ